MTRAQVYEFIDDERADQDDKWNRDTTTSAGQHSHGEWLLYMQDYLTEAINMSTRNPDPKATDLVMENIRKITAMGVAAMEQIDTLPRYNPQ